MKSETTQARTRQSKDSGIDRPENLGKPQMKWGSDVVAEVTRRLDLKYIALVPGASYRGFHDSIVNYLGNSNPQMVICLHRFCLHYFESPVVSGRLTLIVTMKTKLMADNNTKAQRVRNSP